jgi:hypothetical protein
MAWLPESAQGTGSLQHFVFHGLRTVAAGTLGELAGSKVKDAIIYFIPYF